MDKNKAISGYEKIFDDGYKAGRASVVLPHPCDGELYKDWLLVEYIAKVLEEAKEVVDAYIDLIKDPKNPERIKHLAGECTDVQVAATGVMHKLGYGEEERQRVMKEINESNAKRDGGKRFKKHPFDELQERICREKTFSASGTEEKEDGKQIKLAKNNLLLPLEIGAKLMVVKPDDYKDALPGENIYQSIFDTYMFYYSGGIGRNKGYISPLSCCLVEMEDSGEKIIVPFSWMKKVEE